MDILTPDTDDIYDILDELSREFEEEYGVKPYPTSPQPTKPKKPKAKTFQERYEYAMKGIS